MKRLRANGPIAVFGVLLVVAMAIFGIASASVSSLISRSFAAEAQIRNARLFAAQILALQLDEETGIRGWAATGSASFLQPYQAALPVLPPTFDRLGALLKALRIERVAALADARDVNAQWLKLVAAPVLEGPLGNEAIRHYGKRLIDRYRADVSSIEDGLTLSENHTDATTRRAIEQNTLVTVVALVVLGVAGIIVGTMQSRSMQERARSEEEAARLRAAYMAERRVSDAMQEAFLQKRLPTLVGVSF
ncbi:MAG: CHASE3 domain-containing protein, partial [Vulcanimicrobiaceae bacterium]